MRDSKCLDLPDVGSGCGQCKDFVARMDVEGKLGPEELCERQIDRCEMTDPDGDRFWGGIGVR